MTFYPGETIGSIASALKFLTVYGLKPDNLVPRIRTNGTYGGLGQFFQPYIGTRGYQKAMENGIILTERPVRLQPSYIPFSFLDCKVQKKRYIGSENNLPHPDKYWFDLYGVRADAINLDVANGEAIGDIMDEVTRTRGMAVWQDVAVWFALSARLGIIE